MSRSDFIQACVDRINERGIIAIESVREYHHEGILVTAFMTGYRDHRGRPWAGTTIPESAKFETMLPLIDTFAYNVEENIKALIDAPEE